MRNEFAKLISPFLILFSIVFFLVSAAIWLDGGDKLQSIMAACLGFVLLGLGVMGVLDLMKEEGRG